MNERIRELLAQSGLQAYYDAQGGQIEKFAELIIVECMAQPRVYLLNKLDATDSDAQWQLHGWTSDLKVAQAWRDSSGRDEHHDMQDLYFVKHIT